MFAKHNVRELYLETQLEFPNEPVTPLDVLSKNAHSRLHKDLEYYNPRKFIVIGANEKQMRMLLKSIKKSHKLAELVFEKVKDDDSDQIKSMIRMYLNKNRKLIRIRVQNRKFDKHEIWRDYLWREVVFSKDEV